VIVAGRVLSESYVNWEITRDPDCSDGSTIQYLHASNINVKKGDQVDNLNTVLADFGNTGEFGNYMINRKWD
jgi:hypothetical protein